MNHAREFMTKEVIVVSPDTSIREIARLLLDHDISALPVADASGAPTGMVSEGDLIGRSETDREARRDWWLGLVAEGETLAPEFLVNLHDQVKTARDIMSAPVVTIDETMEAEKIVDLLLTHRIKRVPVVRDGRITGIVSRADILRALATQAREFVWQLKSQARGALYETISRLDDRFFGPPHPEPDHESAHGRPTFAQPDTSAAEFRALVAEFEDKKDERRDDASRAVAEKRHGKVNELISHHISDQNWKTLLHSARQAAERGENEVMFSQFPSELCSDGGRAINVFEQGWPATLRGEPAEIYLRWENELKPHGFHLAARVLDFPGGLLGDIGLFLVWG